jgi:hypothetical protein
MEATAFFEKKVSLNAKDLNKVGRTAKMDDSMNKATGGQAEAARSRFDKMLNVTTAESAARQQLNT